MATSEYKLPDFDLNILIESVGKSHKLKDGLTQEELSTKIKHLNSARFPNNFEAKLC